MKPKYKLVTPKELHRWYLEAVKGLNPKSFNPNAHKDYKDLTTEQKSIDKYIARKINKKMIEFIQRNC